MTIRDTSTGSAVAGLGGVPWVAYVWQDAKRNEQAGWWWFLTGITGGLVGPLYVWYRDDPGADYRERVERWRKERDEQLDRQAGLSGSPTSDHKLPRHLWEQLTAVLSPGS